MNSSTRMLLPFITVMLLMPLTACALSDKALEGKVLEEGTDKPVPGAIVVTYWMGDLFAFAESQTVCVHVLTTTTDAQGQYRFPAWRKKSDIGWVRDARPVITAYKPGYEEYLRRGYAYTEAFKRNIRYLKPFTGAREERLRKTAGAAVTCGSAGESQKNLLPLYRKLYEEALPLVVTKNDRLIVNGLLRQIDLIELPYEEVLKRAEERNKALRKEFPNE